MSLASLFSRKRKKYTYIILLSLLWVFCILIVNPIGEFPLNDDWSYAKVVKTLNDKGVLQLTGWTSMPLVAQAFFGLIFCIPFGFSFLALRLSTLVLGLVGVLSTYGILLESKARANIAFFGAVIFLFNPIYFLHSFTFMTDVPFTAVALLSIYFYSRGFRIEKNRYLIFGSILAGLACLIRQLGVVIPLSFAIVWLLKTKFDRNGFKKVFFHFCVSIVPLVLFQLWLQFIHGFPAKYNVASERISLSLAEGIPHYIELLLRRITGGWMYIGLFILPFLVWVIMAPRTKPKKSGTYFFLLSIPGMVILLRLSFDIVIMPLRSNVIFDLGLGPLRLRDVAILGLPNWPQAPVWFWLLITMAGVVCAAYLVYIFWLSLKKGFEIIFKGREFDFNFMFYLGIIILYAAPIIITGYFNRYLIFFPPIVMALILKFKQPDFLKKHVLLKISISLLLILISLFSVGATHDYLSWNRARWKALDFLTKDLGISPHSIDGGFEFNGMNLYDPDYVREESKSYWWVDDDQYIISFGQIAGYKEIRHFPFSRWAPPGKAYIYILERMDKKP